MDWLTYSGQNNRPGDLFCYNFWISNDFTQVVNFPTGITDCNSYSPALLNLFLLTLVFSLQWLSLHWEILMMLLSQFTLTFRQIQKEMLRFITEPIIFSCGLGRSLWLFERSLNSVLLLLLVNFTIGSRLELIYISHLLGFQLLVLPPEIIVVQPQFFLWLVKSLKHL